MAMMNSNVMILIFITGILQYYFCKITMITLFYPYQNHLLFYQYYGLALMARGVISIVKYFDRSGNLATFAALKSLSQAPLPDEIECIHSMVGTR